MEKLTLIQALISVAAGGLVMFFTRVLPFVVFSKKNPPKIIRFTEKYIPAVIMGILLIYCFKDVEFREWPFGAPYFIAAAFCAFVHLTVKNSMVSIIGSTILFIVLSRLM